MLGDFQIKDLLGILCKVPEVTSLHVPGRALFDKSCSHMANSYPLTRPSLEAGDFGRDGLQVGGIDYVGSSPPSAEFIPAIISLLPGVAAFGAGETNHTT